MSDTLNFLDKREINRINTLLILGMVQSDDRMSFVYRTDMGQELISITNNEVRHYSIKEIRKFYDCVMNLNPSK
jgi:hypothetical protein